MKSFVVILAIVVCASAVTLKDLYKQEWITFKTVHSKEYADVNEELLRLQIFLNNRFEIEKHNQKFANKEESYEKGTNEFSDLTGAEFLDKMTMEPQNLTDIDLDDESHTFLPFEEVEYPTFVDWRRKGVVTPVKNQYPCGSCWAFAAAGALEGQSSRKSGKLIPLSVQNLMDCTYGRKDNCKRGGLRVDAFKYVIDKRGIDTEASYPYVARDTKCRFSKKNIGATCKGYKMVPHGEESLKKAVAQIGPIAVSIHASNNLKNYKNGIFYDAECSTTSINHAVLVVGYGSSNGKDYWLVKNSWGDNWGEKGYVRMSRNKNNNCCIASDGAYPLV